MAVLPGLAATAVQMAVAQLSASFKQVSKPESGTKKVHCDAGQCVVDECIKVGPG